MLPQAAVDRVSDTDVQDSQVTVKTARAGDTFSTVGRGRVGALNSVLVTADGVLTEGVASVPQLDVDGKYVLCGGGKSIILDSKPNFLDSSILATAPLRNMSYKFPLSELTGEEKAQLLATVPEEQKALLGSAEPRETLKLWHDRLGHRNMRDLGHAISTDLLSGPSKEAAKNVKRGLCDPCVKSKSTRHQFSRQKRETPKKTLQVVSKETKRVCTDLKGPVSIDGPQGERYMQLFVQEETRWRTCKLLPTKAAAVEAIRNYFTVELPSEGIRALEYHSDAAPELVSKEVVNILANSNCRLTYSPPYTPELNAYAERSNRTVWESAYAMLLASTLPLSFWTYAAEYAVNCVNVLPTTTDLGWMSPFQAKYGVVPDVSIFHIFGCIAYVHVSEQLRDSTLAEKAYKGHFVGLKWPLLDRFLVFVPSLDKVVESAHVIFDEVTQLQRTSDEVLTIDPERRAAKDFSWLHHLAYVEEDNGILYVTTRVGTSRGFIVAYRAPVIDGSLGQEEPQPLHARDVERMLLKTWENQTPLMWQNNTLTPTCAVVLQDGSARRTDHPQARVVPGSEPIHTAGASPEDDRASPHAGMKPLPQRTDTPDDGKKPPPQRASTDSDRPVRERRPRAPLNVDTLGDVTGNRVLYLAAESVLDEDDDTDPRWDDAKVDELHSHVLEHRSYDVAPLPEGRKAIASKWVVKAKTNPARLKARFTPKGCAQKYMVDYKETFAPVAKLVTLRIFLSLVAILGLYTGQLDVKTAFLNAPLEEEIYCRPLWDQIPLLKVLHGRLTDSAQRGVVKAQIQALRDGGVLLIKKAIYGLKQAPRQWWKRLHSFLKSLGFVANLSDICLYIIHLSGGAFCLLLLYVDDILIAGTSPELVAHYVDVIGKEFKVSAEGVIKHYLGFDITIDLSKKRVELCMAGYMEKVLKRFKMVPKQSIVTPLPEGIQSALQCAEPSDERFVEDFEYKAS
jgi:transposase InsO family protein